MSANGRNNIPLPSELEAHGGEPAWLLIGVLLFVTGVGLLLTFYVALPVV
jgi:hypothetical protein